MNSPPSTTIPAPPTSLVRNLRLAAHTTLRLGGPARWAAEGRSFEAIRAALDWANAQRLALLPLGGGSNIVCSDAGFKGLVLRLTLGGSVVHLRPPALAQLATLDPSPHSQLEAFAPSCTTSPVTHCSQDLPAVGHGESEPFPPSTRPNTGSPTPVFVTVGAGVVWDAFVRACCERGWAGLECLSGIPGTVGATPIQNVGAYGQEVSETLFAVTCIDRQSTHTRVFSAEECAFGYRTSRFKTLDRERYVVAAVTFRLLAGGAPKLAYAELLRHIQAPGTPTPATEDPGTPTPATETPSLMRVREAVLRARAGKSMLLDPQDPNTRNCGSFFLNPVVPRSTVEALRQRLATEVPSYPTPDPDWVKIPAAWLIERSGFTKGVRQGNVGLSTKHALCLVAHEGATTCELLAWARRVRDAVREHLEIELRPEPVLVGARW